MKLKKPAELSALYLMWQQPRTGTYLSQNACNLCLFVFLCEMGAERYVCLCLAISLFCSSSFTPCVTPLSNHLAVFNMFPLSSETPWLWLMCSFTFSYLWSHSSIMPSAHYQGYLITRCIMSPCKWFWLIVSNVTSSAQGHILKMPCFLWLTV